jgi:Ca-activated chloride channel homolog
MYKQTLNTFIFLIGCLLFTAAYANAEQKDTAPQLMIKTGADSLPALLLKSHLSGQINGLVVSMTLTQEFKNTSNDWVNGRYVFPLPEEATIDSLTLTNEERVLKGVVKEKQAAKAQFEQAKAAGKKAGLLEQNRPNLFAMSMANIAPQSTVKAEITWVQKVDYEGGVFSLSLPTTLTPRYIPGTSLQVKLDDMAEKATEEASETISHTVHQLQSGWAFNTDQVPDANEITPPQVEGVKQVDSHRIDIDITVNAGLALDKIASTSHAINVSQQGTSYRVKFQHKDELMDRDVLLQWQVAASALPKAAVFSEHKDDAYYHLIMINPPVKNIISTLPKDVTFIIDTSGSMAGGSMEQAKSGLLAALDQLSSKDRFNIIEFDNDATQLYSDSKPVDNESLSKARQFVNHLDADGGTEMMSALALAFAQEEHEAYLRQIIFITDGAVGNEQALFNYINKNLDKARLFTVGIGSAPNTYFMQGAAKYGRGTATQINNLLEVNAKMTRLFEKLAYPVMRDIKAQWPAGVTVEAYPENMPDLYTSEPIMLMARSEKPIENLLVSGQVANQLWQQALDTKQGTAKAKNINKIWAMDKVNALIERSVLYAEPIEKYKNEITDIGIKNQIVTKFTSFIAVEEEVSRPQQNQAKNEQMPNLLPHATTLQAPNTATPASLQLLLGTLLLLVTLGYHLYTQRRNKGWLSL